VGHGQAVPRALDDRPDRPARVAAAPARGSALHRGGASEIPRLSTRSCSPRLLLRTP
jgi:hypothetical protein